ncbi:MAG: alpha/beta fold hydrolase [Myxococcota bacterium]
MEPHSKQVDGIRMRWTEVGRGTPVVLVHGIPTSPALYRKVLPRVADARLLAWEMVGYGESIPEGRGRDLSVWQQSEFLLSWMRSLDIGRAVLVGHDLGGGVVQVAAVREPELCAGLVLTNAIGYDSWPIPSVKSIRAAGDLVSRMPNRLLKSAMGVLIYRGHDDRGVAHESLDLHFAPYAEHDGARALVRQVRALDTRDTLQIQTSLGKLRGRPARVVWGADDPFQKVRYGERFAQDLGCPLTRIAGGKHFVPEDHPDVLATAIEDVVHEVQPLEAPAPARR